MKKLIYLIIFLIIISSSYATTVSVDVPFRYGYGNYNDSHTYFELVNYVNDYPYRMFTWPNSSSEDNNWDFTYHFDSEEVCNGTCESTECQTGGYNWSEQFYNMSDNLKIMIGAMNLSYELSHNLTQEISLNEPLISDLGNCRGRIGELINQTTLLTIEKQDLQIKVNDWGRYVGSNGLYEICKSSLIAEKESKTTAYIIGAVIGGILIYVLFGKKKDIQETEDEGYE